MVSTNCLLLWHCFKTFDNLVLKALWFCENARGGCLNDTSLASMQNPRRCKLKRFHKAVSACCVVSTILWARELHLEAGPSLLTKVLTRPSNPKTKRDIVDLTSSTQNTIAPVDEDSTAYQSPCPLALLCWLVFIVLYCLGVVAFQLFGAAKRLSLSFVGCFRSSSGDVLSSRNSTLFEKLWPTPQAGSVLTARAEAPQQEGTRTSPSFCTRSDRLDHQLGGSQLNLDPVAADKISRFLSVQESAEPPIYDDLVNDAPPPRSKLWQRLRAVRSPCLQHSCQVDYCPATQHAMPQSSSSPPSAQESQPMHLTSSGCRSIPPAFGSSCRSSSLPLGSDFKSGLKPSLSEAPGHNAQILGSSCSLLFRSHDNKAGSGSSYGHCGSDVKAGLLRGSNPSFRSCSGSRTAAAVAAAVTCVTRGCKNTVGLCKYKLRSKSLKCRDQADLSLQVD